MFKFQGAVVKEQGVTFVIIIVKKHVVDSDSASSEAIDSFSQFFPGLPVVLMAQDSRGIPSYRGRKDIVNFLASVDFRRIPWKEYTAS